MSSDRPSHGGDRRVPAALAVVSLLVLLYSLVVAQQILLGLLVVAVLFGGYLAYRLLTAVERLADGVGRVARTLEDREE